MKAKPGHLAIVGAPDCPLVAVSAEVSIETLVDDIATATGSRANETGVQCIASIISIDQQLNRRGIEMKQPSSFATINDLLHSVVVIGAFALTAYGLSELLFNSGSRQIIAILAYGLAVATVAYGAVLAQPSLAAVKAAQLRRRTELATISL